jgi:lysophospholipase L1-like esterase
MARLIHAARAAPVEPGMPIPPILVVAPPSMTHPTGALARKFAGAPNKCVGLAAELQQLCAELSCAFFDAGTVTTLSKEDGIHLDVDQHHALGEALAGVVSTLIR